MHRITVNEASAQTRNSTAPRDLLVWRSRTALLGQPNSKLHFIDSGVTIEITDADGNPSIVGGYFRISNDGDQEVENQPEDTTSIWYPLSGGRSEIRLIAQYRRPNDRTRTKFDVQFRYRCNTKVAKPHVANATEGQSDKITTSSAKPAGQIPKPPPLKNAPNSGLANASNVFPIGCWVIPSYSYADPDYGNTINVQESFLFFTVDGELLLIGINGYVSHKFKFQSLGEEARTTAEFDESVNAFQPIGGDSNSDKGDYFTYKLIDGERLVPLRHYYEMSGSGVIKYSPDDRASRQPAQRSDKCVELMKNYRGNN